MKILLTFFVLLFSPSIIAKEFYCKVSAHGFDNNVWRDYPDNIFLIKYDNYNFKLTDTMINLDWNFEIIVNDNDHISAIIDTNLNGTRPYFESVLFYKNQNYILVSYLANDGVTINKGNCY